MFKATFHYTLSAALLLVAALLLQWNVPINADNSWLLHLAKQINAGKHLYIDIVETNPPLIVWIHQLAATLGGWVGISSEQAYKLMVGVLMVQVAYFIWRQNTLSNCERYIAMIGLFWLLPNNFGQREHLFMLLSLPYLLSLLPAQRQANGYMAAMAAIGCCIKPYFPIVLFVAWGMRCWQEKSVRWLFALPQLIVMAIGGAYFVYLVAVDTIYITQIVPVLTQTYSSFAVPLSHMAEKIVIICGYCFAAYLCMLFRPQVKTEQMRYIHMIFALNIAVLLVLVLQQKSWANHWYLVCMIGLLLNTRIALVYFPLRESLPFIGKFVMCFAASVAMVLAGQSLNTSYELLWPAEDDPTRLRRELLQGHSSEGFYSLSFDLPSSFPAVEAEGLRMVSPHHHLWFLPGFAAKNCKQPVSLNKMNEMQPIEQAYFMQMVGAFWANKPDWVVVGRKDKYTICGQEVDLDILQYYQQNSLFADDWKNYELIKVIEDDRYFRRQQK